MHCNLGCLSALLLWLSLVFVTTVAYCCADRLLYTGAEVNHRTLVHTRLGPISGVITVRQRVNVSAYLAVPYALPPLGQRRFAEPEPVRRPWKVPLRAVRQPPICAQREFDHFRPTDFALVRELIKQDPAIEQYYVSNKSEDCLYLSVFTQTPPEGHSPTTTNANKTVLVWIHGGAFISGTANLPMHDYPLLVASDPDLVVVAVNYRLNVFGFITSGDDHLAGNYGLKDQIAALRWVKENIGAFGGSASKVVVWGQSAGAVAIGYHMMTNQSGDALFHRAIMQSGNPLLPLTLAKSAYRRTAFLEFAAGLNCTHSHKHNQTTDQVVQCLRTKSTEELFRHYHRFAVHSPLAFLPNVEDRSLFEPQMSSFWAGVTERRFSFTGDILIGTNEAEGAQYVKVGPLAQYYSPTTIATNFTRPNIVQSLQRFVPASLHSMVDPVVNMFTDGLPDTSNATAMWHQYVRLVGDMVFVCPDYFFIRAFVDSKRALPTGVTQCRSTPRVYYYRFGSRVSRPVECPRWALGACHTDELQFVFGNPVLMPALYPTNEQTLATRMMTAWLEFAHRGSFNSSDSFATWRPFVTDAREHLRIDMREVRMVKGFPGDRCEDLCLPLYDTLGSLDNDQMKLIKTN